MKGETGVMRHWFIAGALVVIVCFGVEPAGADLLYELVVRTTDALVRGTVDLEETVTVSAKGDRMRQEVRGTRTVVTRRGAQYQKPGYRVTLDQLDRAHRYEINLDAGTYADASFASLRQQHQEGIEAAEKALGVNPVGPVPSLVVSADRTGQRQQVQGRDCERVVLKATKELVLARTRGAGPAGSTPSRFSVTFDLCVAPDTALTRELRALEDRVGELTGARGALADRELRIFESRRDVLAVFELMHRVMEREQRSLGGVPLRWERVFVGPRREQPEAILYRHWGEVTRIEDGVLDARQFDLPQGLTLDPRGVAR